MTNTYEIKASGLAFAVFCKGRVLCILHTREAAEKFVALKAKNE